MKKQYCIPTIIDISLEGVTGIGAGSCSSGPHIGSATCDSYGQGASSVCSFMGMAVGSACTSGGIPFETGSICRQHGLNAAACNYNGNSANQGIGRCVGGVSATYSDTNPCCHFNGSADTNICNSGDANIPIPPLS